jgi:hypothetical protein
MNADTEAAIRHIYERWHETVMRRDIRGLMELYAEDAVLESPLICAVQPELGSGILQGKAAIGDFFAAGSRTPSNGLGRWYRTGHFFANGRQLTWEYPRATRTATKSIWSRSWTCLAVSSLTIASTGAGLASERCPICRPARNER